MVKIGQRQVGPGEPAYLIAELGINHGGELETARRLVAAAAEAGADAVKLQTYRTELRVAADSPIFGVLKDSELDAAAHETLLADAQDAGVDLLSTPFDPESVELLAGLGIPAFKIASFDIVNLGLIDVVARHGKPVIVSRGMASQAETDAAIELIRSHGAPAVLLHCVSAYPLDPADANLAIMDSLRERYDIPIGFSDHTTGIDAPAYAVTRGADVIEKHFTLDREAEGPDHALSADPEGFAEMRRLVRAAEEMLGSPEPRTLEAEKGTLPYRRPTAVGETFTPA